jgi:hypothetical protein
MVLAASVLRADQRYDVGNGPLVCADLPLPLRIDSDQACAALTCEPHSMQYNSFVPPRRQIHCEWFVDGKDYFDRLASALETAEVGVVDSTRRERLYSY